MARRRGLGDRERMFNAALGAQIRGARQRRCEGMRDLAKRLGVSVMTLQRWESGEYGAPIYMVLKIASLYRVPLADLVGPCTKTSNHRQLEMEQAG